MSKIADLRKVNSTSVLLKKIGFVIKNRNRVAVPYLLKLDDSIIGNQNNKSSLKQTSMKVNNSFPLFKFYSSISWQW